MWNASLSNDVRYLVLFFVRRFTTRIMSKIDYEPSSISGGSPPTKTLRENLSPLSDPCEFGDERLGDPI